MCQKCKDDPNFFEPTHKMLARYGLAVDLVFFSLGYVISWVGIWVPDVNIQATMFYVGGSMILSAAVTGCIFWYMRRH
jgi:hypothetical protein